ncbi:phosphoglycerol transferase MdoB-like AlkP superfamily enzyme [Micromonospora sp. A202]|uniref:sulfatase-like hydrolase/transferase n=1 Tax=Micromonospora sp. A202 TaxID=2572899 RepID=UPI001173A767|nr:sulfatase-like hydrolase/transferase [Micromonospora sp. A202]TQJ23199.1 phosphoglycerol transferase MdoB-like AlkP superfamily enzyme [Micromonospora sp. A202]
MRGELPGVTADDDTAGEGRPKRSIRARLVTVLAALLVLLVLTAPYDFGRFSPGAFVRIPLEALLVVALLLALPSRGSRLVATLTGVALGLLGLLKLLDLGFSAALSRAFDLVLDWALLDEAFAFLSESYGRPAAIGAAIALAVVAVGLPVLVTLSVRRLRRLVIGHRTGTTRVVAALVVVWVACAAFDVRVVPAVPVADTSATTLANGHGFQVRLRLDDRKTFSTQIEADRFADTPGDQLLTALRGKNVVLAFVESYGRDAVEDPEFAPQVGAVLDSGTSRLQAAGFAAQSGFLTSPTFGGGSWLAHDTLLSGLWIDNDQRHRTLLASDRMTLNGAFRRANWQTVGVMPAVSRAWPEGSFFGYERFYDARALGYRGPKFSFGTMPDQYTLSSWQRLEQAKQDGNPVMTEIALVSSHAPWTPVPRLVDWSTVGDGAIYRGTAGDEDERRRSTAQIRADYRQSIQYTLSTLVSYVETYGDDDLVFIFLGDHQPAAVVTGENASHDVPITIITRDRAVLDRISGWGWQDGLKPGPQAPVWRMDTFRDRFLTAFGP